MGCFDSVCSLSKLPIHYGDDIVAFYVCSGSVNSFSPEYQWYQMGLPLFGKYNDYGDIEQIDTSHINYVILENTVGKRKKYIKPMDRCQYDEYDGKKPSLIDIFMKNVSRGEQMLPSISGVTGEFEESDHKKGTMKIKTHSGNAVHLVMVHRKVYDYVVEYGKSMLSKLVNVDSINDYLNHRNMWSKDNSRVIRIHDDTLINDVNILSLHNIEEIDYDSSLSRIHRFLKCRENDCFPSVCMYTNQVINEMYSTKADELSFDHSLIQSVLDYKFFRTARIALNLELVPHFSYASNQHRDNHDVRGIQKFHTHMAEIANTLIRDDEEEYEEEE